jgi:hypothetical protein
MIKPRAHGGPDQTIEGVDQHPAVRQYAKMFDDLAKALGFNTCPETMYGASRDREEAQREPRRDQEAHLMPTKIYKRSGFKNYSSVFWVNERGAFGSRYQCKHCGRVSLGMGADDRMHYSTCSARFAEGGAG